MWTAVGTSPSGTVIWPQVALGLLARSGLEATLCQTGHRSLQAQWCHCAPHDDVAALEAALRAQLLPQDARRVVHLRRPLRHPLSVFVQQAARRGALVRLPRRLQQAVAHRLAIEVQLTRDDRDVLASRVTHMNCFPLLLTEHRRLHVLPGHGHRSRREAQGPRALCLATLARRHCRQIFHFHRSLLGGDGWGKFDDHDWGLLGDH